MKKLVALLLSAVLLMSFFVTVSADEEGFSDITYYVEYADGKATVNLFTDELGTFDFGIIYEPDKLTLESYDYSDYFYEMASSEENTILYVKNDKAIDSVGESTYVVFTGAGMETETGDSINFLERELAKVTFSGIDEGEEIVVVSGTARVDDVRNAKKIGAVDLYSEIEKSDSYLLEGAKPEADKSIAEDGNNTWIYGIVVAVIIIIAVALVIVSRKNKLDVKSEKVTLDDDNDYENDDDE